MLDSIKPEGKQVTLPNEVVNAFRALEPFIGTDASRPWSNGILLRGQSAFATNNIIIAEYWLGCDLPEINIPSLAIDEMLRIKQPLEGVTLCEHSITFHFPGDRWMRSQLLNTGWPNLDIFLNQPGDPRPFPDGFFDALRRLKPFLGDENRIFFRGGKMSTTPFPDSSDEAGATIELPGVPEYGAFKYSFLESLDGIADFIDFANHPRPCPFFGTKLRGVIQGMRDEYASADYA